MTGDARSTLSRHDILFLFDRLAEAAEKRNLRVEVFLVGGGAMALAYNTARTTGDLDGVFEPKAVVYELVAEIAATSDLNLPADWLNDGAKGFMPGDDPNAAVFYDRPGLSLRVASPRYLFVMKAMAARESDEDDLRLLYSLAGFTSASDALDAVSDAYPSWTIKPMVQYLVEGIAAEAAVAATTSPANRDMCGASTSRGRNCRNAAGSCPHHPRR